MTRFRSLAAAVIAVLVGMVWSPSGASALTLETSLSTSSTMLGSSPYISGEVLINHTGPGFADNLVLTGTLPAGYTISSVDLYPGLLLGEIWWNDGDVTRLLTLDMDSGDRYSAISVSVSGLPFGSPCGFYGMDVDPNTGDIYGLIGIYPVAGGCDYSTARALVKVDPTSGVATYIGTPDVPLNGLFFSHDGRLFGHGANGAARRGGLYLVDISTGVASPFVFAAIPGAAVTWDDPGMAGMNFDDNLIYHFQACSMATTNPGTKAQSSLTNVSSGCPNDGLHGVTYLGADQFLIFSWGERYIFDLNTLDWDYLGSDDEGRGVVAAGREKTNLAACTHTGSTFTCTIPRTIPLGRYRIDFDGNLTANKVGDEVFSFSVNSSAGSASSKNIVKVAGADLATTAKANARAVNVSDSVTWTVDVENLGNGSASSSQVQIQVPSNQNYGTATASQGSCSYGGGVVTCNLGTIAGGNLARVVVTTTANANGLSTLTASASTSSPELTGDNNDVTATMVVGPSADLAVATSLPGATTYATEAGKPAKIKVDVTNQGPNVANTVQVRFKAPENIVMTGPACVASGIYMLCDVSSIIGPGSTESIELTATPSIAATFAIKVTGESTTPDPDLTNNVATQSLQVAPPTLTIAAGPATPRSGATLAREKAPVLQLVVTHGGQTKQDLRVESVTAKGTFSGARFDSVRVLVVNDANANGKVDEDERVIGNGSVKVTGDAAVLRLSGDGIVLKAGESATLLLVLRDDMSSIQMAAVLKTVTTSSLAFLPLALLLGVRRRKWWMAAGFAFAVAFSAGCSSDDDEEVGAKMKLTITAVEATLADGTGPSAPVAGLPLESATVEVK